MCERLFCWVFVLVGALSPALAVAVPAQPNVIFILADDLGWADTTLYGHTQLHKTPNLERLAKRGTVFSRAYANSPLCSPTRASIITGQSPARTGITAPECHLPEVRLAASSNAKVAQHRKTSNCVSATRLSASHFTLAEACQAADYSTAHFGKWHLGPAPYSPLQHGFDLDLPGTSGPGPAGGFIAPWKFKNFSANSPEEHVEDRMSTEAVAWIEQHRDQPFFVNYWQFSVHAPFDAKSSLIDKYRKTIDPSDLQRSPTYAAMVESMDDAVGQLLDAVDRLGLADRTVFVFFSDNGGNMYNTVDGTTPTSNRPLRGGKATVYEGGVRVPCVVAWPEVTLAGSRSEAIIQSQDFYPTFVQLLGLEPPPEQVFDGVSVADSLAGKPFNHPPIFTYFPHSPAVPDSLPPAVTVTNDDWKLIRLFHQGENGAHDYRLYNLANDLGEVNDLTASQSARVQQLDSLIENFLTATKAVTPQPNPNYNPNTTPAPQTGQRKAAKVKKGG